SSLSGIGSRVVQGAPLELTINLDATVATDTPITLTSSDASILAVPGTAIVPSGSASVRVAVSAPATGAATITAQLGSSIATLSTVVANSASISFLSLSDGIPVGQTANLRIFLDANAPTDTAVVLSSSNPAVLMVPSAVTIAAGSSSSPGVPVTGLSLGQATLTAQLGSSSASELVTVSATPALISINVPSRMQTGAPGTISLSFDVGSPTDTTVTLSSSNPSVLTVPPAVVVSAG